MSDFYQTLGVSKNATTEEIKRAYRKLALKHHPDQGGSTADAKEFKKINEAYQVLSDPAKRQQYDQFGRTDFSASGSAGGAGGFGGFGGFESAGFDFSGFGGGLGDIFDTFFGQAFLTVQAEVEISPAQAVLGDEIDLSVGSEKIKLKIPAGVPNGSQFQFKGKGQTGRNGQKGDLIINIKIKVPKNISKAERDLYEQLLVAEQNKHRGFWNRT